jgi:hypothetical protein
VWRLSEQAHQAGKSKVFAQQFKTDAPSAPSLCTGEDRSAYRSFPHIRNISSWRSLIWSILLTCCKCTRGWSASSTDGPETTTHDASGRIIRSRSTLLGAFLLGPRSATNRHLLHLWSSHRPTRASATQTVGSDYARPAPSARADTPGADRPSSSSARTRSGGPLQVLAQRIPVHIARSRLRSTRRDAGSVISMKSSSRSIPTLPRSKCRRSAHLGNFQAPILRIFEF